MAELVLRVGSRSAKGIRPNNEDRFVVDLENQVFLVADGMGGQERGEMASGMAAEIIPKVVHDRLVANDHAEEAVKRALSEANSAIITAGKSQPEGRRMGTTAVLALHQKNQVFVAGLGDSRAYLIHGNQVDLLTVDHSVAHALVLTGALTPEEARHSPYQHVLHKFLGCANMFDCADVKPITPQAGDRLLLASDGLTNHLTEEDMIQGVKKYPDPQELVNYFVDLAIERNSRDNITGVILAFDPV
jgi:protein phosphatase